MGVSISHRARLLALGLVLGPGLTAAGCLKHAPRSDATGVFETDEVIVASEVPGKILEMHVDEGMQLERGALAVVIDTSNLALQTEQIQASIGALEAKTTDVTPFLAVIEQQQAVQEAQLQSLLRDQARLEGLVKAQAASQKQLDDVNTQVELVRRQIALTQRQLSQQRTALGTQNRGILSEKEPLAKRAQVLKDQIARGRVSNPVAGTVLVRYAEAGEVTAAGKALYKIGDLSVLKLRAYVTGSQFAKVKLHQPVQILVDNGDKDYRRYEGEVVWISDKAEFTPKTIQTRDERSNLVYAVKIRVKNDGLLKLGMYGEVIF